MRVHNARYELADREYILTVQFRLVKELLYRAWSTNDFYRERFRAARVSPENVTSLGQFARAVPTISKSEFLADQEADPPFGRRHAHARALGVPLFINTTSGTSGQGQEVHMQTAEELRGTGESYSYWFRWAGLDRGDQLFLTLPITMLAGGVLEYAGAVLSGLTVYPVGNYEAARKVELMLRFKPEAILGNTSYVGRLTSLLGERRWTGLKALLTGAEGGGLVYLDRLAEAWGAPVFDRYGSSQAGNDHLFTCESGIGTANRPGMMHNIDPLMLVEVIDPETGDHVRDGEQGELIITNLYRMDTPLIRCRIGDWAVYHEPGYCSCGRPFMGVETASISRRDDMKKVKGVGIWPQAVNNAVFSLPGVEEYQVMLASSSEGADVATVKIVPRRELAAGEAEHLRSQASAKLRQATGIRFEVAVLRPGEIDVGDLKARRWIDERSHVVASGVGT